MLQALRDVGFDIESTSHAEAILSRDFPTTEAELGGILSDFRISSREIVSGGGGEAVFTQRLRKQLSSRGWKKQNFDVSITINGQQYESSSHEVDHVKAFDSGSIALEIEWNNKDPFYDRDLENFQRLHAYRAISVGIVITRGSSIQANILDVVREAAVRMGLNDFTDLQVNGMPITSRQRKMVQNGIEKKGLPFTQAWARMFVNDKYGTATTHWDKLMSRVERGVGSPCPMLFIGLPLSIIEQ